MVDWVVSNRIINKFNLKPARLCDMGAMLRGEDGKLYRLADVMKVVLSFIDVMIGDK